MEGDMSECQEDELLALSSIYDKRVFNRSQTRVGGEVNIYLEIPENFEVKISTNKRSETSADTAVVDERGKANDVIWDAFQVKHLPPLVLNFSLPTGYPSTQPPQYTLSCKWLNVLQLSCLCKSLDMLWEECPYEVILFRWIQFLQEETLDVLNISSPLVLTTKMKFPSKGSNFDHRAVQDVGSSTALLDIILDFDQKERERVFQTNYFCCGVCFNEKAGAACIAFPKCEHVFCMECISEYFKIQIESGAVKALTCPETKCESNALPSQVKNLVSPELFAKYDRYLLQSGLDEMSDIVYCPRPSCQSPVILEEDTTMGVCEVCRFAFCSLCKLTYHGVSPCVFRPNEVRQLKMKYENGTVAERLFLERRYGKKRICRMIDELISEEWLVDNSKTCPRCNAHIEKSEGCNKMHCTKCRTNFCWLCGKILNQQNPYIHFNMWNSSCFNKLFEGVETDSDEELW